MDWFSISTLGDIGSPALVALFVVAILRGWLRPQSAVREIREDREVRVSEVRQQYIEALKRIEMQQDTISKLDAARVDQAKVLKDMMDALSAIQRVYNGRNEGGEDVVQEER